MRIGIVSPLNPKELVEYLNVPANELPNINQTATAVHTLVKEYLERRYSVCVYSTTPK